MLKSTGATDISSTGESAAATGTEAKVRNL